MDQDSVPGPTSGISMDLGIFSKSQSRHFPKSNPRIFRDFLKPIHNCLLRVLTRAHNLGHDNRQLIQNIYRIKLRICQNIYYFRFFMLQAIVFPFMIHEQLITSSFCKILWWSILIQSFAKFIMGDILADTAIPGNASNLCVPATSTQAERVFSWMGWLLKKEGSVCHENLSTCNYPWPIGGQSSALDLIHISHF